MFRSPSAIFPLIDAPAGAHFDFKTWTGDGGKAYSITVENGVVRTSLEDNVIY